jgi:hypothetical protein
MVVENGGEAEIFGVRVEVNGDFSMVVAVSLKLRL